MGERPQDRWGSSAREREWVWVSCESEEVGSWTG